ncbi:MAG: MurR/RpiR family transcriptional regulator [Deinococcales bacterium]
MGPARWPMALELEELLREAWEDLTPSQRVVAEYLLGRRDSAAFETAAEVARNTGVSESTVVRLAGGLGLDGYPALQALVRRMLRDRLSTVRRMEHAARDLQGDTDLLERVRVRDTENLDRTYASLSRVAFDRAVELLARAERRVAIGLRTSHSLAVLFATALGYVGRDVELLDLGIGDAFDRLDRLGPGSVAVGFSVPRYTSATAELLAFARDRGAHTIAFTDSPVSTLGRIADVTLTAVTDMDAFFESFTAPLSLVNAVVLAVAMADERASLAALGRREDLWRRAGVYIRPQGGDGPRIHGRQPGQGPAAGDRGGEPTDRPIDGPHHVGDAHAKEEEDEDDHG